MSLFLCSVLSILTALITRIESQSCVFTPDPSSNISYDLSALHHSGTIKVDDDDNAHLSYEFTICGNLSQQCTDKDPPNGCVQQWTDDACTYRLGSWSTTPSQIWALNNSQGFGIAFTNGETCRHHLGQTYYYSISFEFECEESTNLHTVSAVVDPQDACDYSIRLQTKHACQGESSSNATFSTGYLAIIFFFVAIILVMIGYYVVLGIKTKDWGPASMVPPLNLCKYFWISSFVGCKVSMEWIQNKTCRKGGDLGDDLMDTEDS